MSHVCGGSHHRLGIVTSSDPLCFDGSCSWGDLRRGFGVRCTICAQLVTVSHPDADTFKIYFSTEPTARMGQRSSKGQVYGAVAQRKSAWTALACGAALMSDGISSLPYSGSFCLATLLQY